MKRVMIAVGLVEYVIEHVTQDIRRLYIHKSNGCEYVGIWDTEDFEQQASKIFQTMLHRENTHF